MWHNTSFRVEMLSKNWVRFYEPLTTTAPKEAQPYCCFVNTVIFYKDREKLETFETVHSQWDLSGTGWTENEIGFAALAPFVENKGEYYELSGGRVVWCDDAEAAEAAAGGSGGWFVAWEARRIDDSNDRLFNWLLEESSRK